MARISTPQSADIELKRGLHRAGLFLTFLGTELPDVPILVLEARVQEAVDCILVYKPRS